MKPTDADLGELDPPAAGGARPGEAARSPGGGRPPAAARLSSRDLARALALAQAGCWRLEAERGELVWSDEVYRIFGLPKGSRLTYGRFLELVHPEDRELVDRRWRAALSGSPYHVEHRVVVEGRVSWVREVGELELGPGGELLGGFGVCQDITRQKLTQLALAESEARARTMADRAPIMIWVTDAAGRLEHVNAACREFFGTSLHALRTDGWQGLVHPEDREGACGGFRRAMERGREHAVQCRARHADGGWRWVECHCRPLLSGSGELVGTVGSGFEVTERRQTEEALRREHGEVALENRVLEVFVHETGQRLFDRVLELVQQATGSGQGVLGYVDEQGDLVCPTLSAILDECEVAGKCATYAKGSWKGLWARALAEKRSLRRNDPPPVPAGHVPIDNNLATPILFRGEVLGLLNLANKPGGYTERDQGTVEAIAERIAPLLYAQVQRELRERDRRRAEEALLWRARRDELLSETAARLLESDDPLGLVEGICRDVMEFLDCQVFFNFLLEEAAGCLGGRLRLNASAGIDEATARTLETLELGSAACGCVTRDRERIVAESIGSNPDPRTELVASLGVEAYCCHPMVIGGQLMGTLSFGTRSRPRLDPEQVSMMRSVTNLVALAVYRRRVAETLIEADRRKDEFLAMLGHELRNPLAAIATAMAAAGEESGAERRRWRDDIVGRQVGQLRRLVDDLLDVSRITTGTIALRLETVELGEQMRAAARALEPTFSAAGLRLSLGPPASPVFVSADPARLQQVLTNLLTNASKFTPGGGTVRLSAEPGPDRTVAIRCTDSGVGIAPDKLAWIFEPFAQLGTGLDREGAGLGIGLSLVKRLVEMHGGSVSARSEGPGSGSEFSVVLPTIAPPARLAAASEERRPPPPRGRRRVLVAEDNPDIATAVAKLLRQAGHLVRVEWDGAAAVRAARDDPPDVMLVDVGLPGRDGYEVAGAVRAAAGAAAPLLVGISGYQQDRARAEASFDRYFVKPVEPELLLRLVEESPDRAAGGAGDRPLRPLRVLVVEDHALLGEATVEVLRLEGFDAVLAPTGRQALELASRFRPEVVLCDLGLPDMRGEDVAQALRAAEGTASALLVTLTAAELGSRAEWLGGTAFDGVLEKPLEVDELRGLLAARSGRAGLPPGPASPDPPARE